MNNMSQAEIDALRKKATDYLDGKLELDDAEALALERKLQEAAGYRMFTKHHICHGVHYYPTEEKAILAGLAVRMRNETVIGGLYHGMKCGRSASFDHVDKQYGLVFGVTVA